nr:2og-fe oxygenase [Colletotrichum truncatum]KAF6794080.1 2og-fe oxygenase [Colletotrichum truncatum]
MEAVPVIDMAPYLSDPDAKNSKTVVREIYEAASTWGFFLLTGTSLSNDQQLALMRSTKSFFDLPLKDKMALDVAQGGVAWRGYMPLGGEQTHGHKDWKEGLYIGPEHPEDHHLVRSDVMAYLEQVNNLGKVLTDMFSEGLGLDRRDLRRRWLDPEPVILFRCFKYAPVAASTDVRSTHPDPSKDRNEEDGFGIGSHTDFGYLTILKVDSTGLQLQVLSPADKWVDVPVIEGALVINIGDMFDQLTHGRFCSRPHRVRRPEAGAPPRLSFPLFFDFSWNASMERLPLNHLPPLNETQERNARNRWAKTTFVEVKGKWHQYLARKVQKVFPDLGLPDFESNEAPSTRFTRVVNTTAVPT